MGSISVTVKARSRSSKSLRILYISWPVKPEISIFLSELKGEACAKTAIMGKIKFNIIANLSKFACSYVHVRIFTGIHRCSAVLFVSGILCITRLNGEESATNGLNFSVITKWIRCRSTYIVSDMQKRDGKTLWSAGKKNRSINIWASCMCHFLENDPFKVIISASNVRLEAERHGTWQNSLISTIRWDPAHVSGFESR